MGLGNPISKPMIASQNRLTRIMLALAVAGSLIIGLLWWDSSHSWIGWREGYATIQSEMSGIGVNLTVKENILLKFDDFHRDNLAGFQIDAVKLFPKPVWIPEISYIFIPYYLLLVTYLSSIVVAWLVLMNRLTRREIASSADY